MEDLGGSVCSSKDFDFTHYVTMAGKAKDGKGFIRSLKTLLALAGGRPIVEIKWLADSRREGAFVPASAHLLQDTEKEKEYGFSISGSFQAARSRLVFEGVEIFFTPSFLKEEKDGGKDIRTIVMTAGALVAASPPQRLRKRQGGGEEKGLGALVVAVPSDREWAGRALRNGVPILGRDHLLRAVMRQKPPGPQDCLFTT